MIKKLVKYGNSTALVLDKAILELLGMSEGSSVKISTDGKSLIVAPHSSDLASNYTYRANLNVLEPDKAIFEAYGMNDPKKQTLMQHVLFITAQRQMILKRLFSNNDFVREFDNLSADTAEGINIMYKFEPELKVFDIRLIEAGKAIAPEKSDLQILAEANRAFVFFNTKKDDFHLQVNAAQNNPEYRHELALITEEYEKTKDQNAFTKAYEEITKRYAPIVKELAGK